VIFLQTRDETVKAMDFSNRSIQLATVIVGLLVTAITVTALYGLVVYRERYMKLAEPENATGAIFTPVSQHMPPLA